MNFGRVTISAQVNVETYKRFMYMYELLRSRTKKDITKTDVVRMAIDELYKLVCKILSEQENATWDVEQKTALK